MFVFGKGTTHKNFVGSEVWKSIVVLFGLLEAEVAVDVRREGAGQEGR